MTIPSSYNTLDSLKFEPDSWGDAFAMRELIRNTNYIVAYQRKMLANYGVVYFGDENKLITIQGWKRKDFIFPVHTSPGVKRVRAKLRCKLKEPVETEVWLKSRKGEGERKVIPSTATDLGWYPTEPLECEVYPNEDEMIELCFATVLGVEYSDPKGNPPYNIAWNYTNENHLVTSSLNAWSYDVSVSIVRFLDPNPPPTYIEEPFTVYDYGHRVYDAEPTTFAWLRLSGFSGRTFYELKQAGVTQFTLFYSPRILLSTVSLWEVGGEIA